MKRTKHLFFPIITIVAGSLMMLLVVFFTARIGHAAPVVGFEPGRIIDDAVFTNKNSMDVGQIQTFLNAKGVNCTNGESPCLKNFNEGGRSAAQIIYDTAQQYDINPQVLIVLLQKEVGLVTANQPGTWRYISATGYGCPDSSPGVCNANYRGFTNQVRWAATMYHAIMTDSPTWYTPYNLGNNSIKWNPESSCGSSIVYIQNRATKALYNYTPYRPNQAALDAGYGSGDSCSSYGNRNFYQYFKDWFGSTTVYDPYGWNLIKTANDARTYLVVGNTKRWIPSGEIFNDWNLGIKPVEIVSQATLDAIPTIPPLDRLGFFANKYFYVDGGKKYWLSNDALIKAWGQSGNLAIAAPAYIPLSSISDGGEAPFYVSLPSESKVARLVNGQRYMINAVDADRWRANPIALTAASFNSFSAAANVDYHLRVNGIKYLVDDGQLLNVDTDDLLRDYSQTSNTFVDMPADILPYLPQQKISSVIAIKGAPAWYVLRGGERYYIPTAGHARAWNLPANPTMISSRLSLGFPQNPEPLPLIVKDATTQKTFLLDGTKHEASGVLLDGVKAANAALPSFASEYLSSLPTSDTISSPLIRSRELGNIYTLDNAKLYHIPSKEVLNGLGYPRKYQIADVSRNFTDAYANRINGMSMFLKIGSTTYFMQDGNLLPLTEAAKNDWVNGSTVPLFESQNLSERFDIRSTQLTQFVQEGSAKYIISNGTAYNVTGFDGAYLASGYTWTPIAIFGMPRSATQSAIVRSTDASDSRIFSLSAGSKQHVLTGGILSALTKGGSLPVVNLSPVLIATYPQVNTGKDPVPFGYSDGRGFKLLTSTGSFYEFPSGDTLINFASGNTALKLEEASFNTYNPSAGSISRLIKDPSGKVYWVEGGSKRWITSSQAFQAYSNRPITSVDWVVANWLPNGAPIQ